MKNKGMSLRHVLITIDDLSFCALMSTRATTFWRTTTLLRRGWIEARIDTARLMELLHGSCWFF